MLFCTQCGHQANETDLFCANCGARQSAGTSGQTANSPPLPGRDPLAAVSPRTAAILCYVPAIGWIAAVIFLAAPRFKHDRMTRFHAFQGLYLFAAWLVVDWVIGPIAHAAPGHYFPIDRILHVLIFGASIFMMIKVGHNETCVLPIIGELAQKSSIEQ